MRTGSLALLAAALLAGPAQAQEVRTVPVSIPASQPTDAGAKIALDGGVTFPTAGCPCPGVIINHGFLGRWQDSGGITTRLAREGYVVLRYSSRGFGETPGEVDLMGPKETRDLLDAVDWLNDPDNPVVGGMVVRDRIGQFGGSYGGAHAWALAASGHPAVRTTVPTATWTDLYDALMPNGAMLLAYANGFYATGYEPTARLIEGELSTTQNYSQNIHRWMLEANTGAGLEDMKAGLAARSVASDYARVRIPVFIVQGLNDGLFNANQAIEAYQAIRANGVRARLYLGGIGHPPSDGSLDSPEATYVSQQVLEWFDHFLKDEENDITTRNAIEFSRADYFSNRWDGTTRSAKSYPFGPATRLHLCTTGPAGGTLGDAPCPDAPPAVATNLNAGTGYDEEPVTSEYAAEFGAGFEQLTGRRLDLSTAPTMLRYESPVLKAPLDLAGIPSFSLQVAAADLAPAPVEPGTAAAFHLHPKLYAVAPDGRAKLLTRGAFARRLDGAGANLDAIPSHAVEFDAWGFSNRVPAGHRLRITFQTSDLPYLRPANNPFAVAVLAGSTVTLPGTGDVRASSLKRVRCSRARCRVLPRRR